MTAGDRQAGKPLGVGDTVPDFVVMDLGGKPVKLSDLRKTTESGVVSLTFWCTFCHSCREMDAKFDRLAIDLKGKAAVVGVDSSVTDNAASCRMDWESCPKCGRGVLVEVLQQADLFWRKLAAKHVHCVGGCGLTK